MFAPQCQKKFQVVQGVTALFYPPGHGHGGVRPSLQMGRRAGRDTLRRAAAAGQQGKRSAEQARFAPPGERRQQRNQSTEGSRFRRRQDFPRTARSSGRQAEAGSGTTSGTVCPTTRTARPSETERVRLRVEWMGPARSNEPRARCCDRAAGKTRRRTMPELNRFLEACS